MDGKVFSPKPFMETLLIILYVNFAFCVVVTVAGILLIYRIWYKECLLIEGGIVQPTFPFIDRTFGVVRVRTCLYGGFLNVSHVLK